MDAKISWNKQKYNSTLYLKRGYTWWTKLSIFIDVEDQPGLALSAAIVVGWVCDDLQQVNSGFDRVCCQFLFEALCMYCVPTWEYFQFEYCRGYDRSMAIVALRQVTAVDKTEFGRSFIVRSVSLRTIRSSWLVNSSHLFEWCPISSLRYPLCIGRLVHVHYLCLCTC